MSGLVDAENSQPMPLNYKSASLFSGGGFGDIGFLSAGIKPVVLAEIEPKRAAMASQNLTDSLVMSVDIITAVPDICKEIRSRLHASEELFLLSATPPCQGMSKNGIGSLLRSVRRGIRPKRDPRNQLYLPVIEIAKAIQPKWVFFENVCRMMNTYGLNERGEATILSKVIEERLHNIGYSGVFTQVQLADYGLPQTRLRTVGLFRLENYKDRIAKFLPPTTHEEHGSSHKKKWVTLRDAIYHLPELDSKSKYLAKSGFHPLHRVPKWRTELYEWMQHTPEGRSAFTNNTCTDCGQESDRDILFCKNCNKRLPKPSINRDGEWRLIKGFISAYKRMYWDRPASTVTTRSAYACSDHKGHPCQNRVLSTFEVAVLQGIDPNSYDWSYRSNGKQLRAAPDTLLRDILGECVPPLYSKQIGDYIIGIDRGKCALPKMQVQKQLFNL